jgi:hypothetical protein
MKDNYYFSHNSNLHRDPKVAAMLTVYGYAGYGWYNAILEILREQENYRLPINTKYAYKTLGRELDTTEKKAQKFIDDCVNEFSLFKRDEQFLWSDDLLYSMEILDEKRQQRVEAVNKRWKKIADKSAKTKEVSDTTVVRQQYDRNADVIQVKESKVEQSISKDIKSDQNKGQQSTSNQSTSNQTEGEGTRVDEPKRKSVRLTTHDPELSQEATPPPVIHPPEPTATVRENVTLPVQEPESGSDDPISIRYCPDNDTVFFKNAHFFVTNNYKEELMGLFEITEGDLKTKLEEMSVDPDLAHPDIDYSRYIEYYLENGPDMG